MSKRQHRRLPRKLAAYAAAFSASLVTQNVVAGIVYTSFGPGGVGIGDGLLDLDADGDAEFRFEPAFSSRWTSQGFYLFFISTASLAIAGVSDNGVDPRVALSSGDVVDATGAIVARAGLAHRYYKIGYYSVPGHDCEHGCLDLDGPFIERDRAFLGLVFELSDGLHAGWADIEVHAGRNASVDSRIFGYAYETITGKPITAGAVPEPPSLALLAAGAAGLAALRMKRRTQS